MPPIRKGDGTPVAPKGISQIRTGDGRILFDGDAIPDSVVYYSTVRDLSDMSEGDTISSIPARVGDWDLEGVSSPKYNTGINGNPSASLDGDGFYPDGSSPSDWEFLNRNAAVTMVMVPISGDNGRWCSTFVSDLGIYYNRGDTDSFQAGYFDGSTLSNPEISGFDDGEPHLLTVWNTEDELRVRQNGSEVYDKSNPSLPSGVPDTVLHIGINEDGSSPLESEFGAFVGYDDPAMDDIAEMEDKLGDGFDINID